MFEDCVPKLRELYTGIGVVASPLTRESAKRRLVELGVDVHRARENGRGCAYRRALEAALQSEGKVVYHGVAQPRVQLSIADARLDRPEVAETGRAGFSCDNV